MKRRVVVTGLGAITPMGNSVDEFWSNIKRGCVGIDNITRFDTSEYKVKLAAEVKNFQAKDYMDFKSAKRMAKFSQYAVAAAKEAVEDAGLCMEKEDPFRCGVIIGSGIGSLETVESEYTKIQEKGPGKSESIDGAYDDFQYGSRECGNSVWNEREMYQCSNSMCNRNPLYWGCIQGNSVWRWRCDVGRWDGKCYLPKRSSRFYELNSAYNNRRST